MLDKRCRSTSEVSSSHEHRRHLLVHALGYLCDRQHPQELERHHPAQWAGPRALRGSLESNTRAIKTWLGTGDLRKVILEIYNPATDKLVTRWDIDIVYGWSDGDGSFWTDTEQLKYAIKKAGLLPSQAKYKLMLDTKPGRPDVEGGAKEVIARRMEWSSRA